MNGRIYGLLSSRVAPGRFQIVARSPSDLLYQHVVDLLPPEEAARVETVFNLFNSELEARNNEIAKLSNALVEQEGEFYERHLQEHEKFENFRKESERKVVEAEEDKKMLIARMEMSYKLQLARLHREHEDFVRGTVWLGVCLFLTTFLVLLFTILGFLGIFGVF
ncbi:hypothetical protein L596_016288 [Steinernema carpocapsae]|uniref:Transmembrane protein n=1 Tax=Steinernema carpocapsae TaxID=34508 RepID=A0A4U5NIR3_STECR|nr:hypothetical protein L596_016288 [Steinernema carpocapsae]